jgi:hypothetical protein
MITKDIEEKIIRELQQSMAGNEIESPKFDCKKIWYNTKDKNGLAEFLKDTSAIANTFGPDGYILIGYDDKKREFTNVDFSQSGLADSSDLLPLITKHISEPFTIAYYEFKYNNNNLGVLHIPASIQKPHFIRNYVKLDKNGYEKSEEHRVFIRKNTGTYPATKYDIDIMYYDRKNIIPDYEIYLTIRLRSSRFSLGNEGNEMILVIQPDITLENVGRRPVVIESVSFELTLQPNPSTTEKIGFHSVENLKGKIIRSNEVSFSNYARFAANYYNSKPKYGIIEFSTYLNSRIDDIKLDSCSIEMTNAQLIVPNLKVL